jgi:hypothetical protein
MYASSRYGKRYTHDCERARSRISGIYFAGRRIREIATRDNIRDMSEYRVSVRYTDKLAFADEEIRIQVFVKTSSTILVNSQHGMSNRS